MDESSGWNNWIQEVGKSTIGTIIQSKYAAPVEIQKLKLQAQGPFGEQYTEGETTDNKPVAAGRAIPASWLFIGGAVALVMLLKD